MEIVTEEAAEILAEAQGGAVETQVEAAVEIATVEAEAAVAIAEAQAGAAVAIAEADAMEVDEVWLLARFESVESRLDALAEMLRRLEELTGSMAALLVTSPPLSTPTPPPESPPASPPPSDPDGLKANPEAPPSPRRRPRLM